jgi:predicted ATPase
MSDGRNVIQAMFSEANRYPNFGQAVMRIHITGFRCHKNTIVEVQSPIIAFCGLNGTGKSTILQLAATAYSNPNQYYIKDFIVVGTLDPAPFSDDATVEFKFWQADRSLKPVTLSRRATTKRWQGYARRPQRSVLFAGIGMYLPKIEQRDFIVRNAARLAVSSSDAVSSERKDWTCRILGQSYDTILSNTVTYSAQKGSIVSVQRAAVSYSEAHMGYGEGRSQYLVARLETLPEQSLVLIEEPETSLHQSAQYEFGRYLVDVVRRKHHQILLTTHSEFLLEALPSLSRVYLQRTGDGIQPIPGLTALQAKSLMSQGHTKALCVLVEDPVAKAVLAELVRRIDPDFLRSIEICPVGNAETVAVSVRALKDTTLPVAAVRDGDKGATPSDNIFKLPGSQAPEREIFGCAAVRDYILKTYRVNVEDFLSGVDGSNHHEWFKLLATCVSAEESALVCEVARVYAAALSEAEIASLTTLLKEASRK